MNIIFICTGNTCRSPMIAGVYKKKHPEDNVSSAGLSPEIDGEPANKRAINVAKMRGVDISDHRARGLNPNDILYNNLFVVMEIFQAKILEAIGIPKSKILVLDVPDPYGHIQKYYEKVLGQGYRSFKKIKEYKDAHPNIK